MNTWLLPSLSIDFAISILWVLFYYLIWVNFKKIYLLIWTLGWLSLSISLLTNLLENIWPQFNPHLSIMNCLFLVVSASLLIFALSKFANFTSKLIWGVSSLPIINMLWAVGVNIFLHNSFIALVPSFLILGLSYIALAIFTFRWRIKNPVSVTILLGVSLLLLGLNEGAFSLSFKFPWFYPVGYSTGAILNVCIGVSFIVLYFQQTNSKLVEGESCFRQQVENDRIHFASQLKILAETSIQINALHSEEKVLIHANNKVREIIGEQKSGFLIFGHGESNQDLLVLSNTGNSAQYKISTRLVQELDCSGLFTFSSIPPLPLYINRTRLGKFLNDEMISFLWESQTVMNGCLSIPLFGKNEQVFGSFIIFDKNEGDFSQNDQLILVQFAQIVAIAIEKARLNAEINLANEHLQSLAKQVITAREKERLIISRELHDEFAQILIVLKLNLLMINENIPEQYNQIHACIKDSTNLTDNIIHKIRDLVHSLRPPCLEFGLDTSLKRLFADFSKQMGIQVICLGLDILKVEPHITVTIYRLFQESLTNIAKHAKADCVWVSLEHDAESIELIVKDNGKGFNLNNDNNSGFGLINMRERLELLGGLLSVTSRIGQGTVLTARIPLEEKE